MWSYLANFAPWTRVALTRFSQELRDLEGSERFETLVARLRSPERYSEGASVLRVAARLRAQGFTVEFDPTVTVFGGPKQPDLLVVNPEVGDRIFVEVSSLGISETEKEARKAFDAVTNIFWAEDRVNFSGRLLRVPSPQNLDQIIRRVKEAIVRCKATGHLQEVMLPNLLELAVAPPADQEHFRHWVEDHKAHGFSGPATSPDIISRIKGKLRNEQKQLPRNELGLIVVDVPPMHHFGDSEEEGHLLENLRDLGEFVAGYPHLLGAVLCSEFLSTGTRPTVRQAEGQVYVQQAPRPPFAEDIHLLTNRYCKLKLAPATMTAWNRAFLP